MEANGRNLQKRACYAESAKEMEIKWRSRLLAFIGAKLRYSSACTHKIS